MKIDLTAGTWQDNPGCPINITLVSTSDAGCVCSVGVCLFMDGEHVYRLSCHYLLMGTMWDGNVWSWSGDPLYSL